MMILTALRGKLVEHVELYNDDPKVINDKDTECVAPASVPISDKVVRKKHSWNMLRFSVSV